MLWWWYSFVQLIFFFSRFVRLFQFENVSRVSLSLHTRLHIQSINLYVSLFLFFFVYSKYNAHNDVLTMILYFSSSFSFIRSCSCFNASQCTYERLNVLNVCVCDVCIATVQTGRKTWALKYICHMSTFEYTHTFIENREP